MRSPRRRFAASFVVTLAALPACGRTVDHRDPVGPTQPAPPTTGDTAPRDHRDPPTSWDVTMDPDGTCVAQADGVAPEKITCPREVAAPGVHLLVDREPDGTCTIPPPMMDCPAGMSCNPPPPQPTECPHP